MLFRSPNDEGRNDEQYQELGDGNSDERGDLQLNADLPTVEEQQNIIEEAEVLNTSAFVISQEDIDAVLSRGSGVVDGKYRIYEQFLKNKTTEENANMLKDEYGWGGAYPALDTDVYGKIDEMHDAKGIKISTGSISEPAAQVTVNWSKVAKRIGELIADNRYLNEKETAYFPMYQQKQIELAKRWQVGTEFNNIVRDFNDYMDSLEEHDKKLNQYVLTDCGSCFALERTKTSTLTAQGDNILPLMQNAMETVIAENIHLTD